MTGKMDPVVGGIHETLLVVEDEPLVRMPIAEFLRDCGYTVVEAGDAAQAIAALDEDNSVSLVFSDIRMPGTMDGFGLAQWMQSHRPQVPVILTSGYTGGREPNRVSASAFINKPYSQVQVAKQIAAILKH